MRRPEPITILPVRPWGQPCGVRQLRGSVLEAHRRWGRFREPSGGQLGDWHILIGNLHLTDPRHPIHRSTRP